MQQNNKFKLSFNNNDNKKIEIIDVDNYIDLTGEIKTDENSELSSNKNNKKKEIKIDEKSELTFDFMIIIAKYYQSNNDFINTMKVNKQYKPLVSVYRFNPISDTTLFENIQTQHIYNKNDINNLLPNKFRYINWTKDYYYKDNLINKRSKLTKDVLRNIFDESFKDNKLFIPNQFHIIGTYSLYYSLRNNSDFLLNVIELYLPYSVKVITSYSIFNLRNLKSLHLPDNSDLSVEFFAVKDCEKLTDVYIHPNTNLTGDGYDGGSFNDTGLSNVYLYNDFTIENLEKFFKENKDVSITRNFGTIDNFKVNKIPSGLDKLLIISSVNEERNVQINLNYSAKQFFIDNFGMEKNANEFKIIKKLKRINISIEFNYK